MVDGAVRRAVGGNVQQAVGRGRRPSLAFQAIPDRLRLRQLRFELCRPLLLSPRTERLNGCLDLPQRGLRHGGKVLSTRTRRSGSRAAALLRLAAVTVGRTQTALGAFYRRLSARVGKAKAVTAAPARKIATLILQHHCDMWAGLRRPRRCLLL